MTGLEVLVPFRTVWVVSTVLVGLISQAAENTGAGDASGFAIAAIIAASCTGIATLISTIVGAVLKYRAYQARRHKRPPTRAELLRQRAKLDAQLRRAEEDA